MATFEELTQEQQDDITNFVDNVLRPLMSAFGSTFADADAANSGYNATTSANLALMGASDVIPSTSTLQGNSALTQAQTITMVSYLQGVITNYNTAGHRQEYARAAGPQNIV